MASIPTPSLVAQAAAILEAATSLQRQLEQHGLQQPSFEAGGRKDWHDAIEHPEVLRARSALIDASNLMLNMALGPMDILSSLVGPAVSKVDVFRTLDALGVSEAVPLDTPISIDDLAARVGANPRLLRQQLRFAYLMGIFYEPREGYVAHTSISAAIPSLSAWTRMRLGYLMSSGAWRIPEALRIWQDSPPPGHVQVPVSLADSKGRDFWSALQEEDPENRGMEKFSSAMKALFASHSGNSLGPFVTGFDWAGLGDGLVVDVGGGNGHIEVSILNAVPSGLNFVIQDQETNRGLAIENIRQHGAADRIQFQVHDFFHPQPPHLRPKAYLLSRILHDWQDGDCVRILRNLVPGMEEHAAQLFVMERVLPDRSGDIPNHMEQLIRTQDLLMFTER
ncbi:O-methyltransferase-domain-containing protein [Durotheca rogersii]|uniref:O-methyltransferase-domain-containing protein n=1 Tax=Durotheca rogersii TaxID=419775 RepID=UPI00221F2191|nr:O-methyltransferase-domain-containing protein [Durotheca rogersii]KAI5861165.1 O-methyltransferase-domain-containing protein [Durotheca rogersii]